MITKQLLNASFLENAKDLGTSVPGHIIAFDEDTQLAQLQIGIVKLNKKLEPIEPSPIIECPIVFSGGDYCIEHEVNPGDEGIIMFSQRCIDGWRETGGIANNPILRFHDTSDAYFIPGLRSQPNKLKDFKNNGIRLRNKTGDSFIWLKNDGTGQIKLSELDIDGKVYIDGKLINDHKHDAGQLMAGNVQVSGLSGENQ